jgi:molybdenum cofactor guanylyltransferase
MGEAKHETMFDGRTLLDRVVSACAVAFDSVTVVCNPAIEVRSSCRRLIEPPHAEPASLFGVVAALEESTNDRCWVIGVDFPLITGEVLSFLRSRAEATAAPMVVPWWRGHPQMLCAAYSKSLIPAARRRIAAGDYKLRRFLTNVDVERIAEEELKRFGPEVLTSVNRRDELEFLEKSLSRL